jgi:TolB-like protein/Flp pilus assembly protein TadD
MSISPSKFHFNDFEVDPKAYELRHAGKAIKLERRPMDLLLLLLERRGELVSRAEILDRLWGKDVFVDVDLGVNTAIRKIRQVLKDDHRSPKFVETVPGKGYRFIAPVEIAGKAAEAVSHRVTLAVLPFANLGGDPEREYLAEGMTEEAIAAIGLIDPDHLAVIGRTSVTRYKQTSKSVAEIGAELNAAYLLEGSVRAEGERLRITARLLSTGDQSQIWSASYDSEPRSILSLQRELSAAIAQQIRLRLLPERMSVLAKRQTENVEAYDLYLRGRYFWNQLTPATTKRALDYYRRATELDPGYALAWSGQADAYSSSPINGDVPPQQVWKPAQDATARAIEAADLAEVQTSLGFLNLFLNWNWSVAETAFRRATELDGNYALGHRMLGVVLGHLGRHEEALRSMRRARELDPLYAMYYALSALLAVFAGDIEAAVDFGRQATVIDPEFWIGHLQLAQAYESAGKPELALEALTQAGRFNGGNSKVVSLRGYIYAQTGRVKEAHEVLNTLEAISRERYVPPYASALVYAGLGTYDSAMGCLERAFEVRDVHLIFLPVDPKWNALRNEARFKQLLARCNFAGEGSR